MGGDSRAGGRRTLIDSHTATIARSAAVAIGGSTREERSLSLGQMMRRARRARSMTPADLARQLGREVTWIYGLEAGRRAPRLATVAEFSAALDVAIDVFALAYADPRRTSLIPIPPGSAPRAYEVDVRPDALGAALRNWRGMRGLTQAALAMMAAMHPKQIGRLENGRSRAPTIETIYRIAVALALADGETGQREGSSVGVSVVVSLVRSYI